MKKIIVLYSGGLDSTTVLYWALSKKYQVTALTFDYGQMHRKEILLTRQECKRLQIPHYRISIKMPWKGSALLDAHIPIPMRDSSVPGKPVIPVTYVPARNALFLAYAASCAEALGADAIAIGANAIDYSGYPDCRPRFLSAFQHLLKVGTKAGVEGRGIRILAPLVHKSKGDIVRLAARLRVPFHKTWSCYQGGARPCGHCESCRLRRKGFESAGFADPAVVR